MLNIGQDRKPSGTDKFQEIQQIFLEGDLIASFLLCVKQPIIPKAQAVR
uniref:Uncharacterized protein n=1 Tax=Lotus japonicus TaxID=34305 RepID=I3SIG8_LOTJA|nr:unknown [Lotus japonicus]